MKRPYGTGHIYEKSGAYYGRWRTPDGRRRNRRLGPKREAGSSRGLTRAMAERALRQAQQAELAEVSPADDARDRTVDEAANALCDRLELEGARKSYLQNCESMQRVHISPAMGGRRVAEVSNADVETLARAMRRRRSGDASPDLQFLTVAELEAVLDAIPNEVTSSRVHPGPRVFANSRRRHRAGFEPRHAAAHRALRQTGGRGGGSGQAAG